MKSKIRQWLGLMGFVLMAGTMVGCGKGAGVTTAVAATALDLCGQQTVWEARRNCLVNGYRADIDRCYGVTDEVTRINCVALIQNRYNLQADSFNGYRTNSVYDRRLDPFYYQQADYFRLFSANTVDPWQLYWSQAYANRTYYNGLYTAWYISFYNEYDYLY